MVFALTARVGKVECRNRESSSPYDSFALTGILVVGSEVVPIIKDPIAINETMSPEWFPKPQIFDGFTDTRSLGLVLRAHDIDNNDQWKKHRAKAIEVSNEIAKYGGKIPFIGEPIKWIADSWHKIVDLFVMLDNDDQLLEIATTVNLPDASPFNTKASFHAVTIRGQGETLVSDWDYSVTIEFSYRNLDVPSFGHVPKRSGIAPKQNSLVKHWLGRWVSGRVTCYISESLLWPGRLNVAITESQVGSPPLTFETTGAHISRVWVETFRQPFETIDMASQRASLGKKAATNDFTRTVVERVDRRSSIIDDISPHAVGASTKGLDLAEVVTEVLPARERSGADLLELTGDGVLEMYEVLQDGKRSGIMELRYIRPVNSLLSLTSGAVDETLRYFLV